MGTETVTDVKWERDSVNHPTHYAGSIECIDAMADAFGEEATKAFALGNAFKYLWRCKKKGCYAQDLMKARWYIDYLIKLLGGDD